MPNFSKFYSQPGPKNLELLLSVAIRDENVARAIAEWIVANKPTEDDPVLLCYYQLRFGDRAFATGHGGMLNGQAEIVQGMEDNYAKPIIGGGGGQSVAFHFESWTTLIAAHDAMGASHNWAFYVGATAAMRMGVQPEPQTVDTICITGFSNDNRNDVQTVNTAPYQFFEA